MNEQVESVNYPFGYFVGLDLYDCQNGWGESDMEFTYRFLEKLVVHLGMTPMAPPYVIHAPSTFKDGGRSEVYPDKAGVSAWQPLIESGIQIHTIEPKKFVSIDIFTCGKLDVNKTIDFVRVYYNAERVDYFYHDRGVAYHD